MPRSGSCGGKIALFPTESRPPPTLSHSGCEAGHVAARLHPRHPLPRRSTDGVMRQPQPHTRPRAPPLRGATALLFGAVAAARASPCLVPPPFQGRSAWGCQVRGPFAAHPGQSPPSARSSRNPDAEARPGRGPASHAPLPWPPGWAPHRPRGRTTPGAGLRRAHGAATGSGGEGGGGKATHPAAFASPPLV